MATRPPEQRNLWVFLITVPYWVNLLIRTLAMLFLIRDEVRSTRFCSGSE